MSIYKISCQSSHGTYFAAYLKSVTVMAIDVEDAMLIYKKWSKSRYGYSFEEKELKNIRVDLISDLSRGVIDFDYSSDY